MKISTSGWQMLIVRLLTSMPTKNLIVDTKFYKL